MNSKTVGISSLLLGIARNDLSEVAERSKSMTHAQLLTLYSRGIQACRRLAIQFMIVSITSMAVVLSGFYFFIEQLGAFEANGSLTVSATSFSSLLLALAGIVFLIWQMSEKRWLKLSSLSDAIDDLIKEDDSLQDSVRVSEEREKYFPPMKSGNP